jgi:hypothetical protein
MRAVRAAAAVAAVVCVLAASGCALGATKARVFITRDGRIVATRPVSRRGELILEITNNDDVRHRPLLLRLDDGRDVTSLPRRADGTLDAGGPGDLEHRGDGYRVVEKLDTMRAYFGGGPPVKVLVHTYVSPGRYALVDDIGGAGGDAHLDIVVPAR